MNLEEFTIDFIENIRNDSVIQGVTPSTIFLEEMSERLQSLESIFNPTIMPFYKQGSFNRLMRFDLFAYDDYDKSFVLLVNDFSDDTDISVLTQTDINQLTSRMLNFIQETNNATIFKFLDPSHEVHKLALDLKMRLDTDFDSNSGDISIDKFKLFIITNKKLSNRVSNLKLENFLDRSVELNVWDIERIFDLEKSGREKESIIVDFNRLNGGTGIPYLKADFGNNEDYDAYLAILPGQLLSDIYWEHGSRLLEGNVRAFLTARGKVNRGIRQTINKEPGKFFTYNNGIACTAKDVTFSKDKKYIERIEDLQIINGGQTTASLTTAWRKDKANLEKIFVPMKLTIIKNDEYDEMIQNISRYANSQNKVTEADLFSNHAFHRRFETLSRNVIAPAKPGDIYNTYWYYERSRGKYQQSQFKLNSKSQIDEFKKKYPRNQVIIKEDLAKYIMAAEYLRPDLVSRGRAKNMSEFAIKIHAIWVKDNSIFNEVYFKKAICYAILFKTTDKLVANASWYNVGGIKLNIVPYTISKIVSSIPENQTLDFNRIWKYQELYPSLIEEINAVAQLANEFINDSKGVIVTEHAKKENTWKQFKDYNYRPSKAFLNDLINVSLIEEQLNSAKKEIKEDKKISIEKEIFDLAQTENGKYWDRLVNEGVRRQLISFSEENLIKTYICELSQPIPKRFPSPAQYQSAWNIRKRLEDEGVLV